MVPGPILLATACAPAVSVYNATVLLNATSSTLYKVGYAPPSPETQDNSASGGPKGMWNAELAMAELDSTPVGQKDRWGGIVTAGYNGYVFLVRLVP